MNETLPRPAPWALLSLGVLIGLLSGLFGVGGGIVLVPLLMLLFHYPQRLATGTSTLVILPAAVLGGTGYALLGNVNWPAVVAIAIGVVIGARIGSALLARAPIVFLRWLLMTFMAVVIVSLWVSIPERDAQMLITWWTLLLLAILGLVTGVLSGMLGIGGGNIVVPVLMLAFGASDLVARGTSLLMMIPGSLSTTIGNLRHGNVDVRAAVLIGIPAAIMSLAASWLATLLTPLASNLLFSLLLLVLLVQMLIRVLRARGSGPKDRA